MRNFVLRETRHLASLLQREKVARFTAADEVLLQYIAETNPISPCSHPDPHPNLNREARRSLTWNSSESESALERFEPVAVAKLWLDGRGTLFALVAARRQKVFKRGILSSFCPFRSFRTSEKNSIRKFSLCFFAGEQCSPLLSSGSWKLTHMSIFPCLGDADTHASHMC